MGKNELLNKDKVIKPREIIFIKVPENKIFTKLERLIYNYILFKLSKSKKEIIEDINKHKEAKLNYLGYVLDLSFNELYKELKLSRNKATLIEAINNLRNIDLNKEELTTFNFGRKNKVTYEAKLLGDFEYTEDDDSYFKIIISKSIIENIVLADKKDYITMYMEDMVKFKKVYSLGLYEVINASYNPLLKNQDNNIKFFIPDLRSILSVPKSYNIVKFRNRVLDTAIEEIENKTDFKISYELSTADIGKTLKYITFNIVYKKANEEKRKMLLQNKKVKNLKEEDLIEIIKDRQEIVENKIINNQEKTIKKQQKRINFLTKLNNEMENEFMLADENEEETELSEEVNDKDLEVVEEIGIPFN